MFLEVREKLFVNRSIRRLLKAYSVVSESDPELSGKDLYREVLIQTRQIDKSRVDKLLQEAENSVDVWTAPGRDELGFREVAHYFVFSRYLEAGHNGTEISIKDVIDAKIPSDI